MYARRVDLMFSNTGINIIKTSVSGFHENDEVAVYPNPATTRLNFFIPKTANEITVFNGLGEKEFA